jgi:gliding motility-associated-like protein
LEPIIEFSSIGSIDVCGENSTPLTSLNLSQNFTNLVVNGTAGFSVQYYLTEEDANTNTNNLIDNFNNITNPQVLYTRITNNTTNCYSVNQFSYNVLPTPQTNSIPATLICDDDLDGFDTVNLVTETQNIIPSLINRDISFYTTENDAVNNTNVIANPTNFSTQSATIYIRITNTLTSCYKLIAHSVFINVEPQLQSISPYVYCEDYNDGIGDFILANKDLEISGTQTGLNILYFETNVDAINRSNPVDKNNNYQNISSPQTIFVRLEYTNDLNCYTITEFELIVSSNPIFNDPSAMFLCDDISNDGFETFDLSEKAIEMSLGIADNLNFSFYSSYEDANTNTNVLPNNYTNTSNPQEIFVRVNNGSLCQPIHSFLLNVYLVADINEIESLVVCDDDYDGLNTFDLNTIEDFMFNIRLFNIEVSYFENETDLLANNNSIDTNNNYSNTSNPQTIYVKVLNTISGCFFSFPLDLVVNPPPGINDFITYDICENEADNIDLSLINTIITNNTFNKSYTYYLNLEDASAENNAITGPYNPTTTSDNLYVRVANVNTDCYVVYPFVLQINPIPIVQPIPILDICDTNNDGVETINLETQNALLLQNEDPSLFTVSYYSTIENAQNATGALSLIYNGQHNELIYVRIENNTTGCYSITNFNVILQQYPVLNLDPVMALCVNGVPLIINAQQATDNNTYLWSTGATTAVIEINEIGNYWVIVTSENGCTSENYFEVISSSSAEITTISVSNFSPLNTISVAVQGNGEYVYSLDNGNPQNSATFSNVAAGPHTLQVIDINGCAPLSIEVFVFNVPKFFTPNNDAKNDFWKIKGANQLEHLELNIFDRFGKFIFTLNKNSRGWDGTLNNIKLPSTDYWYNGSVVINGQKIILKGHFALVR